MASVAPSSGDDPKQQLLERMLGYLTDHGIGDISLRELAAALGTSHRMLIYHFGSKEGLFVAVVQEAEKQQRQLLAHLFGGGTADFAASGRRFWQQLRSPDSLPWNGSSSSSTGRHCKAGLTPCPSWPVSSKPGCSRWSRP